MEKPLSSSLDTQQKMLKNVKGLMLGRVIILTLLLAITFIFQISEKKYFFIPLTNTFYYFISFFYFVTIIYTLLLKRVKDLQQFALTQIIIDHLFITLLIYFTGGKESFFPITYIFSVIGSSIIFYKRGAFFSASLSTFLYGLLLLLQLHQWINPLGQPLPYEATQIFYSLIIYMAAFYIVAFLSSAISEELKKKKKELIQKQVDYNQLENFNRNIIQSLDSGLLTIDQEGRINFLNRTAEKILNCSGEDLHRSSIYDLFPQIHEAIEKVRKKSPNSFPTDYQRYETLLNQSDGKKTYLGFSISPLTDPDGSLIGHTLIFQDITKFKEMEEQMKRVDKMAAIGLLAAGMAHEIRNPLASLSGSIQMLKSELQLDPSQRHLMEITLRESERLNALITDFLLFAQPPQTHRVPMAIEKLLDETIEMYTHSPFYREGIRLIRPNLHHPVEAWIDADQMKQVFWNLLLNASQAITNGGEIQIQIEKGENLWGSGLSEKNPGREWVKISFSDSGKGIDPEEKEKIFEPFYTTKEGGTGLGLSIVHKIIENHHGLIKVESQPGKGSTFTILLPAD
ncbi:MAG: two-component system sensor histidine kinase NtrB [Thermodesulfobacteriota bacterium]